MTNINNIPEIATKFVNFYFENKDLLDLAYKVGQSSAAIQLYEEVRAMRESRGLPPVSIQFISKEAAGSDRAYESANCNMRTGVITIPL